MCMRSLTEECDCFFVTEEGGQAEDSSLSPLYRFPQINRKEKHFLIHFLKLFFKASKVIHAEKPDAIISTGALVTYPFCVFTKLRGGKVIYIESFARVNNGSLTGKLVYPIADLFLVQWEPLLKVYKKAKYVGGIF